MQYIMRLLIVAVLAAFSACMPQPVEPEGMPRQMLLHEYMPGLIQPQTKEISSCLKETAAGAEKFCKRAIGAWLGSSQASLSLAKDYMKRDQTVEAMYWLGIAAQNGHADGMYMLGSKLYNEPYIADPVGSKIRGKFWLEKAAKNGSKYAALLLEKIKEIPSLGTGQDYNSSPSSIESDKLRCGEHPEPNWWGASTWSGNESLRLACKDIPILERQALSGDSEATLKLINFFAGIEGGTWRDSMYWNTVAGENGDMASIGRSLLDHQTDQPKDTINKIRARFWLEKAARGGDESAKRELHDLAEKERLKRHD